MKEYSFLMSVYYKEKPEYLIESIESMLAQTVMPKAIIIIQDGKLTDELYFVIESYKKKYSDLFDIIALDKNVGLGNALNHGIKKCSTELIARMDSDDICLPTRCEKQLKKFDEIPDLDIVGTQIDEFMGTPENIVSSRLVPCTQAEIKEFSKRRSPFNHPTVMYRKKSIVDAGYYSGYGRKEDLELFVKMMLQLNCKAANLSEKLLLYRTSSDNLKRRKTWQNCSEYIKIMYGFFRKHYLNIFDILYVILGQLTIFILPKYILKHISNKLLRN